MMDSFRNWLLGIVFVAFASGLAVELVPKGREQTIVRMVCGILAVLAILRPLGEIPWEGVAASGIAFEQEIRQQAEFYRYDQEKVLAAIIAERTESYIWDKANELGMECAVRVEVSSGGACVPLPDSVEIGAVYDPVLAEWIEEVVGIPAENQIWQEERVWEKRTESG